MAHVGDEYQYVLLMLACLVVTLPLGLFLGARVWRRPGGHRLRAAHNVHHLFGGAPFGFLAPVVPARLRATADARGRDDTPRAVRPRS
ncbi:MAG TPA: hypothetical protein VI462_01590 [Acidimicrobiia bacterium]|jgi:hypothetical protein